MLPPAGDSWTLQEAAHLLNRAGFGGSPGEIRALHAMGRRRAVESLLTPSEPADAIRVPEWAEPDRARAEMQARAEQRRELRRSLQGLTPEEAERKRRETFQEIQRENRRQSLDAQGWWFRAMLSGDAPLREKMTLFWHDHFATSQQKVREPVLLVNQNLLFRQQALGSFKDLTAAIVMDPAMMIYLDTRNSRKGRPNENFAREVMELFTMGEGHYSEQDVREAARAFTGYQIQPMQDRVSHNLRQWDDGSKNLFGRRGKFNGRDVVDLIFEQPATARFMARKLWEFFVYENPSDKAVDALANVLRGADYRIAPLLRAIFLSREFYSEAAIRSQIKCPLQFLLAMLKQLEIGEPPAGFALAGQQQLGQVLFMPPNVAGWDWGKAWINTNTLLARYNLAGFLTKGSADNPRGTNMERTMAQAMAPGTRRMARNWQGPDYEKIAPRPTREDPAALVDELIFRFFQGPVPAKARESFVEYAIAKKGAIFTNKEVAELCHLMLSTPYYQLC